ncbi:patatin-like phospholipase family protein [Photobacterium sanctipauli]|uniref:patatin-like phospholipase family protein n=1 Tax=Photobacterium sanctipauli TaxID=1342794 RepID=UPI001304850E|nr:patatin-like phospholipase family protein [Photobacterium sanctipauli]
MRLLICFMIGLYLTACTASNSPSNSPLNGSQVAINQPLAHSPTLPPYSATEAMKYHDQGDIAIMLSFSGGGTRAAAFSYGVLKALHQTIINTEHGPQRLLDEVDFISSVSGGSFTAAYYGLYGDKIFDDFESAFLYKDVGGDLFHTLFDPRLWFSSESRSAFAIDYFQDSLFHHATFADLQRTNGPTIILNATDLGSGVRFSFLQEYFDLLCSDLSHYPVADAVMASAAVPVMFSPVVLNNYPGCKPSNGFDLERQSVDPQIQRTIDGLRSYQNKQRRKYIHLVDGGISDNLGLLAIYDLVESSGGSEAFIDQVEVKPRSHMLIISVDASTEPYYQFEQSADEPSITDTLSAITDTQLHRYNDATKKVIWGNLLEWAELAEKEAGIATDPYFLHVTLKKIPHPTTRFDANTIPTDFTLDKNDVTLLVDEGERQLLNHPLYNQLLEQLND